MRILQIVISVAMITFMHSVMAIQTTEAQLDELGHLFEQQTLDRVLYESKHELDKHLNGLSASQSIWLKQQWLRKLAMLSHPSAEQQAWLENQLTSTELLTIANPDHPKQLLNVINIAQQAKASQQHWKINQQAALFEETWETTEWRWQDLASPRNGVLQKAFSQWISLAEQRVAEQLAHSYLIQHDEIKATNNFLLALLAEHAKSEDLYALLWRQPADEFSYQALAKLPKMFEEFVVVEQTILANKNKHLQSQALYLLAERYSHRTVAQQTLLSALDDQEAKWLTVAVLNKISDQNFMAELKIKINQQKPSTFRTLALKKIAQAPKYEVFQ